MLFLHDELHHTLISNNTLGDIYMFSLFLTDTVNYSMQ